jgi:putative transposase
MEQYRTIKLKIKCNKSDFKKLLECNKESAIIWNECIKRNKELFEQEKKLLSKGQLEKYVQKLPTNIICANNKKTVSKKVFDAYMAISKARKAGRDDLNYPYKFKKYYPTEWDYQFMFPDYQKNTINLTTARYIDDKEIKRNGKQLRLKFKTSIPENIKTLKLIWDKGFYACISYLIELEEIETKINNFSSIDLGEIHSITSIDNHNNQLIITGRKIREIKQFRNKKQAELRSKIDRCKKGSRQRENIIKHLTILNQSVENN